MRSAILFKPKLTGFSLKRILGGFWLLLLGLPFGSFAQNPVFLPLDIPQLLKDGKAVCATSTLDIGNIEAIFDDDPRTLARSANINPMVVTLSFQESIQTNAFKVVHGFGEGWFTLEAADNKTDLEGRSGSYLLLEKERPTRVNGDAGIPVLATHAVSRKVFRLTLRRTTGDNYVHLQDWMVYGAQTVLADRLSASPPSIGLYVNRSVQLADGTLQVFAHAGQDSFAVRWDVLFWSVSNPGILLLDTLSGTITGMQPGVCDLTGRLGDYAVVIPVVVTSLDNGMGPDLGIRYIRRLPEIDYVENSTNPAVEGWPASGQAIIWRARVRNWSDNTYPAVGYQWKKNGEVVSTGNISLAPGAEAIADLPEVWAFQRDTLEFVLDPDDQIKEFSEINNSLLVYTNAISINFYVEQSLYDFFYMNQHKLGLQTNSWDDWAQILHVRRWNRMFKEAVFPSSPQGVLDRIRIDSIAIVPDDALPLAGGLPSNNPNTQDHSVDLQWGFPFGPEAIAFYTEWPGSLTEAHDGNPFSFEGSLLHELGHARYLIDTYGMDLATFQVEIEEESLPVAGSKFMPVIAWEVVYYNKNQGLMSGDYTKLSPYDAACLNQITHHRALCGNMNAPCNIGIFINDIPENCWITVTDTAGFPLRGAAVEIYAASPRQDWYDKVFDDVPEFTYRTDDEGKFLLAANPFAASSPSGKIEHGYGYSNMDLILRVEKDNRVGYFVVEATDFHLEFWSGHTDTARLTYAAPLFDQASTASREEHSLKPVLFPNPAGSVLHIRLPDVKSAGIMTLYSASNQMLGTFPLQEQLDLSRLPAGYYILEIRSAGRVWRGRFIRQ